jgi:hypothetical protein
MPKPREDYVTDEKGIERHPAFGRPLPLEAAGPAGIAEGQQSA